MTALNLKVAVIMALVKSFAEDEMVNFLVAESGVGEDVGAILRAFLKQNELKIVLAGECEWSVQRNVIIPKIKLEEITKKLERVQEESDNWRKMFLKDQANSKRLQLELKNFQVTRNELEKTKTELEKVQKESDNWREAFMKDQADSERLQMELRRSQIRSNELVKTVVKLRLQVNQRVKKRKSTIRNSKRKFVCPTCYDRHYSLKGLKKHLSSIHDDQVTLSWVNWGCVTCGETFVTKGDIDKHRKLKQ